MSPPFATGGGPAGLLGALVREVEARADREACGFVVRAGDGALWILPVTNTSPEGRRGFVMDAAESLSALRWADRAGGAVVAVYHSHLDCDAALSERDRDAALLGGRPSFPGADQVVISLRRGRAVESRRYRWDGRDFRPAPIDSW